MVLVFHEGFQEYFFYALRVLGTIYAANQFLKLPEPTVKPCFYEMAREPSPHGPTSRKT